MQYVFFGRGHFYFKYFHGGQEGIRSSTSVTNDRDWLKNQNVGVGVCVAAVPGEAAQVECHLPSLFAAFCFSEHPETKLLYIDFMSVFQDLNRKLSL